MSYWGTNAEQKEDARTARRMADRDAVKEGMREVGSAVGAVGDLSAQQEDVLQLLSEHGWSVERLDHQPQPWWIDELWTLRSDWSPAGETAFVAFLVDPEGHSSERSRQPVWAVTIMRQLPAERAACEPVIPLSPNWRRERLPLVDKALKELRGVGGAG
jgi:hypothetical protein